MSSRVVGRVLGQAALGVVSCLLLLLVSAPAVLLVAAGTVTVNLGQTHSFSPNVYGVNFATSDLLSWGSPLNRNGGNAMSCYNWEYDSTNSGQDYYFLNHPNGDDPYPTGSSNDVLMQQTFNAGSSNYYVVTIPTNGHVSAGRSSCCSFPTSSYPNQQSSEGGCGNGIQTNGEELSGSWGCYDYWTPQDAVAFVGHMRTVAGASHFDQYAILQLDNEPDIWAYNHRDVYPSPLTYANLWSYTESYASAIKAAYPNVKIAGPIWCCWCGYLYSSADNCQAGSDYSSHGNTYITPWYIQQLNTYKQQHGVQLVDYLDIHYYPNVPSSEDTQADQAEFTSEVRSFYDSSYVDPAWIGQAVNLLPRFYSWIGQYGPNLNLGLAVSEYSFTSNGDDNWSAALANAEVLSVFAQFEVAYAARWVSPASGTPAEQAFKMYLNYDGHNSKVEGVSATVSSTGAPLYTAYAVYNSATARTFVMIFNKDFAATNSYNIVIENAKVSGNPSSFSASVYSMNVNGQTLTAQPSNTAYVSGSTITIYGFWTPERSASLIVLPNTSPS